MVLSIPEAIFVFFIIIFAVIMAYQKEPKKSIPVVITINPLDYLDPGAGYSESELRKSINQIVALNPDRVEVKWCPGVAVDESGTMSRLFGMVVEAAKRVGK